MQIYLSPLFIDEVRKIIRSESHSDCERVLIDTIYNKPLDEVIQGGNAKKLGGSNHTPFVRRGMERQGQGKSGGYRLYLWAFKIENDIYLIYIHPKTGRRSASNISADFQRELVKDFKKWRDSGQMIRTRVSNNKIVTDDSVGKPIFG